MNEKQCKDLELLLQQLQQLEIRRRQSVERQRAKGNLFNIFDVLKKYKRDERYTHSAFIGNLLNVNGTHGCGDAFLKKYIDSGINYLGLDICPRENTAFVCDLNNEPLPQTHVDMYFMAGLLYYINDIDNLFSQMTNAKYILYDYGGTERYLRLDGVPHDPLINARNNFFSQEEIFNSLHKYGFNLENAYWDTDKGKIGWHIYLFKNSKL